MSTLATSLGVDPSALAAARALASMLARQGREEKARVILEGVVALDDRDAWTWRALASLALRRGDPAAALDAATRAVQLARSTSRTDAEATLLLARALLATGRAAEAGPWLATVAADPFASPGTRRTARALARRALR